MAIKKAVEIWREIDGGKLMINEDSKIAVSCASGKCATPWKLSSMIRGMKGLLGQFFFFNGDSQGSWRLSLDM